MTKDKFIKSWLGVIENYSLAAAEDFVSDVEGLLFSHEISVIRRERAEKA